MSDQAIAWSDARPAPAIPGLPLIGNFVGVMRDPFALLAAGARDHGRIFTLRLAGERLFVVWAPEDIKSIMVDTGEVFGRASGSPMERVVGRSILVAEGDAWRRLRAIAMPAFHAKSTAPLTTFLDRPLGELCERLVAAGRRGVAVDLEAETSRCFFDFVCQAIFGAERSDRAERLTEAAGVLLDEVARGWIRPVSLPLWVPSPGNLRLRRARRTFDSLVDSLIDERRRGGDRGDLLSLLLAANQAPEGGHQPLTEVELRGEVASFLIGGYETTATTMMWTLALLAAHPSIAARLRESLDPEASPGAPEPLLDAVLHEAMRLYPAAYALPRETRRDAVVAGSRVPAGSRMLVLVYLTHRDPRSWQRPNDFEPDRFLDVQSERPPHAFIPFGLGAHRCIGTRLAMTMLRATLRRVLAAVDLVALGPVPQAIPRVTLRARTRCLIRTEPR